MNACPTVFGEQLVAPRCTGCSFESLAREVYAILLKKMRYAQSLIDIRDFKSALQIYSTLDGRENKSVFLGKAICLGALGEFTQSRAYLERHLDGKVDEYAILTGCMKVMDAAPDLSVGISIIEEVNKSYCDTGVDHALDFARSIRPPKRELLHGSIKDSSFRLSASGESKAVMLAFGGFRLRTGNLPDRLLDRFFAGHGVTFGTLVDPKCCIFWHGVPDLGQDMQQTVRALKDRLEGKEIFMMGNSAGGTGSMIYGSMLGARRVLSFSGQSDLRASFLEKHGDTRGKAVIHALNRRLEEGQLHVRGWLEGQPERCPIDAYYCTGEPGDVVQAENLASFDEVTLHPLSRYAQHESIASALGTGTLLASLNGVLDEMRHS